MLVTEEQLVKSYGVPQTPKTPELDSSTFFENLGAAFRQENTIGSFYSNLPFNEPFSGMAQAVDPDYNVLENVEARGLEPYLDKFTDVFNDEQFEARAQQIEKETADREILRNSGAKGVLSNIIAGSFDIVNLIPIGGAVVKGIKAKSILQASINTARVAAPSIIASEALLNSTQETRTMGESVVNIVAGTVLAAGLGAGVAATSKAITGKSFGKVLDNFEKDIIKPLDDIENADVAANRALYEGTREDSIGAARALQTTLEQESLAPSLGVASATKGLTPGLRLAQSPVKEVRKFAQKLVNQSSYLNKNFENIATIQSVENLRFEQDGRSANIVQGFRKFHKQHLKLNKEAGTSPLNRKEFNEAMSYALRNNDIGATDEITTLAKQMRSQVIDPLKDRAIELGLLPEDVNPQTADSYLTRIHSREKILAKPDEWKGIMMDWANKKVRQIAEIEQSKFGKDIAKERAKITKGAAERQTIAEREITGVEKDQKKLVALHEQRVKQKLAIANRALRKTEEFTKGRQNALDKVARAEKKLQSAKDNLSKRRAGTKVHKEAGERLKRATAFLKKSKKAVGKTKETSEARKTALAKIAELEDSLKSPLETKAFQDLEARVEKFKAFAKKAPVGKEIKEIEQRIFELETEQRLRLEEIADEDYAASIVDELFVKLTGLDRQPLTFELTIAEHGPLKDRTLDIQDNLIADFLENDAEHILEVYNRKMTGQLLLKEQFDTINFDDAKKAAQDDFNTFIKGVDEKDKAKVTKEFGRNLSDMRMLWDLTNGTYKGAKDYDSIFVKGAQDIRTLNYQRLLGGVTISSFPDVANLVLVNGYKRVFGDLLVPAIRNIRKFKPITDELRDAGLVYESVLNSRIQSLMEIGDPTARGTAFSRTINNMSTVFTRMIGITYWNDFMKAGAGILSQGRMIKNSHALAAGEKLSKQESAFMKWAGLDDSDMLAISELQKQHGGTQRGILLSGASKWENNAIARKYRTALNKDVNSTIVTKGLSDIPAFGNTELGKTILQFQNFSFAAHQRITIRTAQRLASGDLTTLQGITSLIGMGMMVAYLKSEGHKPGTSANWSTDKWLLEGIDRSGMIPVLMMVNNPWERLGLPGLGTAAAAVTGNESEPVSRYAARGTAEALLGPTFGTIADTMTAVNSIATGQMTDSDVHRLRKLMPFQNVIGLRQLIDEIDPVTREQ